MKLVWSDFQKDIPLYSNLCGVSRSMKRPQILFTIAEVHELLASQKGEGYLLRIMPIPPK